MAAPSEMPQHLHAGSAPNLSHRKIEERDWTLLLPDVIRKIADEKLLAVDVTEYIKLRAVCRPWRTATIDPSVLHPRFFPRNWLMLVDKPTDEFEDEEYESEDEDSLDIMSAEEASPAEKMEAPPAEKTEAPPAGNMEALSAEKMEVLAAEERTRFVNVRTGATLLIRMRPEYGDVLTIVSAEGLLVLDCDRTDTVRLYNPLTTATTLLPGLTANITAFSAASVVFDVDSPDRPTVVLVVNGVRSVAMIHAKPGDDHWGTVDMGDLGNGDGVPPPFFGGLPLHGRFFVTTRWGEVFEVKLTPHPRLALMIRPSCCYVRNIVHSIHHIACYLVPSLDDGMLLVPCYRLTDFDVYGVHLGNLRYTRLTGLGNRTVFLHSRTLRADKFPFLPQGTVQRVDQLLEDYF